jgi:3-hydroxybutyryl-CoA dehydrogenase
MDIERVFVVGAGTMGRGIAQAFAQGGLRAVLYDAAPGVADQAFARIRSGLDRLVEREKMTEEQVAGIVSRLQVAESLDDAASCQFALEAIVEDLDAKSALLGELDTICPLDAILATNTSGLSVTALGRASGRPEQFVGMHFFNPAPVMKLVELVITADARSDIVATAVELARSIGKEPVQVKDSPGFIVNRLLIPMLNEAILLLEEGVASVEDIDTAMKLGCGFPMGPLELSDLVGNDITLAVMDGLHAGLSGEKYRPADMLRSMVQQQRLGRKTGSGFTVGNE